MAVNPDFLAPCGLYCGVCAIYMAHQADNRKFKERLLNLYKGGVPGKGTLPGSENLTLEEMQCDGCRSGNVFVFCRRCEISDCTREKGVDGCHECDEFPCRLIEAFPMAVGKKVMLRAIPHRRRVGTEQWALDEEKRYICPVCGNRVFRGVVKCNRCRTELDLD